MTVTTPAVDEPAVTLPPTFALFDRCRSLNRPPLCPKSTVPLASAPFLNGV